MKNLIFILTLLCSSAAFAGFDKQPFPISKGGTGNTTGTATVNANSTGDVTSVGNATTIAAHAVTVGKMAQATANTFLGNGTGSTADITAMSADTARTALAIQGVTAATCNTSTTLDFSVTPEYDITLTNGATCVMTCTNMQAGSAYVIRVIQGSAGTGLVTWCTGSKWPGGTVPTLTATNASIDVVTSAYNGTNFLNSAGLNFQ